MSVREYVGARYVPIFLGEWDNQNKYEPLSVVLYQGASYTSRQYVPQGVAITNTAYWVLSGNYNAQVEAYRQEVRAITPFDTTPTQGSAVGVTSSGVYSAIKEVSDEVADVNTNLTNSINNVNTTLTNALDAAVARIAALEAKLADIGTLSEGKTYGVLKSSGFLHD